MSSGRTVVLVVGGNCSRSRAPPYRTHPSLVPTTPPKVAEGLVSGLSAEGESHARTSRRPPSCPRGRGLCDVLDNLREGLNATSPTSFAPPVPPRADPGVRNR